MHDHIPFETAAGQGEIIFCIGIVASHMAEAQTTKGFATQQIFDTGQNESKGKRQEELLKSGYFAAMGFFMAQYGAYTDSAFVRIRDGKGGF
ncbi:MAG: hypothetical protein CMH60_07815 [Myxococcales bacterium]|nr:hypothetical protein [Myxococcales bacterium]